MKKKMLVLLVVLLLVVSTVQVAFAAPEGPDPPNAPPTAGSCNMVVSWWAPGEGPGTENANGGLPGERGMVHVHTKDIPDQVNEDGYTYGAQHMDDVTTAQCGG